MKRVLEVGMALLGFIAFSTIVAAQPPVWHLLSHGFGNLKVAAVAVDPRNPRLIYTGAGGTVYRSEDGGGAWRPTFRAPASGTIQWLAIDPFDARHVVAATSGGLYGSTDGGSHWQRLFRGAGAGESNCQTLLFHPARRHTVWLGTAGGHGSRPERG